MGAAVCGPCVTSATIAGREPTIQTSTRITLSWAGVVSTGGLVVASPLPVLCGLGFVGAVGAWGLGRPGLLGKHPDGRIAWWSWWINGPYLAVAALTWRLTTALSREACYDEIVPGILLGRRPTARELRASGARAVLDLTCELAAPMRSSGVAYHLLPTLDGCSPPDEALTDAIRWLQDAPRPVYVHCAAGHGRSALVVAGSLVRSGLAPDAGAAEEAVRAARPGIGLKRGQRRALARVRPCPGEAALVRAPGPTASPAARCPGR